MAEHNTEPAAEPDSPNSAKNAGEGPATIPSEPTRPAAEPTMEQPVVRSRRTRRMAAEPTMEQPVVRQRRATNTCPQPAPPPTPADPPTPRQQGDAANAKPAIPAPPYAAATRPDGVDPSATMELPHMVAALAAAAIRDSTARPPVAPERATPLVEAGAATPTESPATPPAETKTKPRGKLSRRTRKLLVEPAPPVKASAAVAATGRVEPGQAATAALPTTPPAGVAAPTAELPRTVTSATPVASAASASAQPAVSGGDPPAQPSVLRRWGTKYGWVTAAGAIAAIVLLCSLPFVSGAGPTWNSADPNGTAVSPSGMPTASASVAAAVTVTPSPSPSPTKASPTPRPSTAKPTPRRTQASPAPRQPVLLGPNSGQELYGMLDAYCRSALGGKARAWLRDWRGPAENNWLCREPGKPDQMIDMTAACVHGYGKGAIARYTNRNDLSSWRCYR